MSNDYREGGRDSGRDSGRDNGGDSGRGGRPGGGRRYGNDHGDRHGDRGGERRGIPLSALDPSTTEASRKVIGCSIEVHRNLGPGYPAKVYEEALKHEMTSMGVQYKSGHKVPVSYKGQAVGEVEACLFIENLFFVCVTSDAEGVAGAERTALRAQLKAANLDLGLIINFGERRLKEGLVRVLNIDKINAERGLHHDGMDDGADHHSHDGGHDGGHEQGTEFNQHA